MKKLLPAFCLTLLSLTALSQLKEGRIVYERLSQMQVQFKVQNPQTEELIKQLPKVRVTYFELLFGNSRSIWQLLPDVSREADQMLTTNGNGTGTLMISSGGFGGTDVIFHDFANSRKISSRELNSKKYLIEDTITRLDWKMSEETKTILGYSVHKAVAEVPRKRGVTTMENGEFILKELVDNSKVIAWYTPQVPVSAGPLHQGQLPGAILELDIDNGQTVYKAVELSPKVSLASLKEPRSGKKISSNEFDLESKKTAEEMRRRLTENGGRLTIQQ